MNSSIGANDDGDESAALFRVPVTAKVDIEYEILD